MAERKYAVIRTEGDYITVLKFFTMEDKNLAMEYGERVALDNEHGTISCILAQFNENGNLVNTAVEVCEVWVRDRDKFDLALAYKDKDGNGFGTIPFILDDFNNLAELTQKKKDMVRDGYKEVVCFRITDEMPEEITWEYVNEHKLRI